MDSDQRDDTDNIPIQPGNPKGRRRKPKELRGQSKPAPTKTKTIKKVVEPVSTENPLNLEVGKNYSQKDLGEMMGVETSNHLKRWFADGEHNPDPEKFPLAWLYQGRLECVGRLEGEGNKLFYQFTG